MQRIELTELRNRSKIDFKGTSKKYTIFARLLALADSD